MTIPYFFSLLIRLTIAIIGGSLTLCKTTLDNTFYIVLLYYVSEAIFSNYSVTLEVILP